jgi:hypothetical protein
LRNNKDNPSTAGGTSPPAVGPVVTQKDQEDLKQLLESLKANDVMPVVAPYRKVSNNMNNNNFGHQQPHHRMHHRPSFLNLDGGEEPGDESGGANNARRYHPPFSFAKYPKLGGGAPPGPASYVPSFGGPPPRQAAPLPPTTRISEANHQHELSRNGPVIGRGLFAEDRDSNQNPVVANGRVHFGGTRETVANFSTKMDFTARVVESFSGFHLDGHDSTMLGICKTRSQYFTKSHAIM